MFVSPQKNKYNIVSKLAVGQHGIVYVVERANIQYVAKTHELSFKKGVAQTKLHYEREQYKFRLSKAGAPPHPNFVEYFIDKKTEVLIISKCETDLKKLIGDKKLSTKQIKILALCLLTFAEKMHKICGIGYYDFKTMNLLCSPFDPDNLDSNKLEWHRLFISDFDMSQPIGAATTVGGTPKYCSIHVHEKGPQNPIFDIESIGYILLELKLGKLPWEVCINDTQNVYDAKKKIINNSSFKNDELILTILKMIKSAQEYSGKPNQIDYDFYFKLFIPGLKSEIVSFVRTEFCVYV